MPPADEPVRFHVAFAALWLERIRAEYDGERLAKQPAAPLQLQATVFGRSRAHGVARVEAVDVEIGIPRGDGPDGAVRGVVPGTDDVTLGVVVDGVSDDAPAIAITLGVETALVVRAVVIRPTAAGRGTGGGGVLGVKLQQVAARERLPGLEP